MLDRSRLPSPQSFPWGEDVPLTPYEREWSEGKKNLKFAGGSPATGYFFLCRQEKVTKKKATPVRCPCGVPCAARPSGWLRNSPLRGSDSARRLPPASAPLLGSSQGIQTNPSLTCVGRIWVRGNLLYNNGTINKATILIILISGFTAGPAVSL